MTAFTEVSVPTVVIDVPSTANRGKGRIKARQTALAAGGCSTALQTQPAPSREEEPAPRFARWLLDGFIPGFDVSLPKAHNASWELLRTGQPAAFFKCPLAAALEERWALPRLAKDFGARRAAVDVLCSDERADVFLEHDAGKNTFGSFYHIREPATRHLRMSFPDFAGCLASWTAKKVLVREVVMQRSSMGSTAQPCEDLGAALQEDLTQRIDWPWLQEAAQAHRWGEAHEAKLEVGSCNGLQPARYDCADRLMAQVRGRRRVLLVGPEHAHTGLYAFPVYHPYDRYAQPDLERPDLASWPRLGDVRGRSIVLRPGEALFVPACWFAHVHDMDEAATSLELRFGCGMRLRSPAAMQLAISRLIEERVALVEGVADVRRWLLIIADDEEEGCINVGTVAGYRRAVMCQEVRDEIEAVLGRQACAREVLHAMCDGRLVPTPWLNQSFRDPLYLADKPVRLPDLRTEEEIKYPELFRHRTQTSRELQRLIASS